LLGYVADCVRGFVAVLGLERGWQTVATSILFLFFFFFFFRRTSRL
jgi:hypothetical protein